MTGTELRVVDGRHEDGQRIPVAMGNQTYRLVVVDDAESVSPPAEPSIIVRADACLGTPAPEPT